MNLKRKGIVMKLRQIEAIVDSNLTDAEFRNLVRIILRFDTKMYITELKPETRDDVIVDYNPTSNTIGPYGDGVGFPQGY